MPEPRFKNDMAVPPGGVYFYEVDTAGGPVRFEASSVSELWSAVCQFQDANSIPRLPNFESAMMAFMCPRLPNGFCDTPGAANPRAFPTLRQVREATSVIARRAFAQSRNFFVSQAEADRRASICATCPLNSNQSCGVCNGLMALVQKLVGRRETKYDVALGTCQLCGCLLRVKAWISDEALRAATSKPSGEIPEVCWLRGVYDPKKESRDA